MRTSKNDVVIRRLKLTLFTLGIFACYGASAQTLYRTYSGHLIVTGIYRDIPLRAESHGMDMLINYETAELEIHLDLKTLVSNNDSLNRVLLAGPAKIAHFQGKMQIDFVNTKGHPKQKFPVDGTLIINGISQPFTFKAELVHLESGELACSLSGEFAFNLSTFFPDMLKQGFDDHVHIKFWEIILDRIK